MKPSPIATFQAPGRTELCGNHTDHNHGRVVAAAIDRLIVAEASPREDMQVRLTSDGFESWEISLEDLNPQASEVGYSQALVRGVASGLKNLGLKWGGFEATIHSAVPQGSGLSSSAAFEVLIGSIFNLFYNNNSIDPMTLAKCAQAAENQFFGKPCGLMDQSASALGGITALDFRDPRSPLVRTLSIDWESWGIGLFVVQTGGSHADLTDDYAAIPREMKAVARAMGASVLREIDYQDFLRELPRLSLKLPPRALLRALHFFGEDQRAGEMISVIESQNVSRFLDLIRASGSSSWRYLQNTLSPANPQDQTLALALGWAETFLGDTGAVRVHGGGFAGTIQAFVPLDRSKAFITHMELLTGQGSVMALKVITQGASGSYL